MPGAPLCHIEERACLMPLGFPVHTAVVNIPLYLCVRGQWLSKITPRRGATWPHVKIW